MMRAGQGDYEQFAGRHSGLYIQQKLLIEDRCMLSLYYISKGRSVSALLVSCDKEQLVLVVVQLVGLMEKFHTNNLAKLSQLGSD